MVAVIGEIDDVLVDCDTVRPLEDAFAPGLYEASVTVVDQQWMLTTVEDVDAVLRVGRDAGYVAVDEALRQLLPVLD